nr:MAG TPA: hypothetical protein [Caudoviricetes sp.]
MALISNAPFGRGRRKYTKNKITPEVEKQPFLG